MSQKMEKGEDSQIDPKIQKEAIFENKSNLESLPSQPLKMIFDQLKSKDLKSLRQTSTTMRSLLENLKNFPQAFWMFDCEHHDKLERFSNEVTHITVLKISIVANEEFGKALKNMLENHKEFKVLNLHINTDEDTYDGADEERYDQGVQSMNKILDICRNTIKHLAIVSHNFAAYVTVSLPHLESLCVMCGDSLSLENMLALHSQTLTRLAWKFSCTPFNNVDIVVPRLEKLQYLCIENCWPGKQLIGKLLRSCSSTLLHLNIVNVTLEREVISNTGMMMAKLDFINIEKCCMTERLLFNLLKYCERSVTTLKLCELTISDDVESGIPDFNLSKLKRLTLCCTEEDWTHERVQSVLTGCGENLELLQIMITRFLGKNMLGSSFCPRKLKTFVWMVPPGNIYDIEVMEMLSLMPNLEKFQLCMGNEQYTIGKTIKVLLLSKLTAFDILGCNSLTAEIFQDLFSIMPNLQKLTQRGFSSRSLVSLPQAASICESRTKLEHLHIMHVRFGTTLLNRQVNRILSSVTKLRCLEFTDAPEISKRNLVKAEKLGVKLIFNQD